MWHHLDTVAENQRLDKETFIAFAKYNREKYHLDDSDMVSTWYCGDLVKDFRQMKESASYTETLPSV